MQFSTNRNSRKILKILLSTKTHYRNIFYADEDFYKQFRMKKEVINQSLNALAANGAIRLSPCENRQTTKIEILQPAFSYLLNSKEEKQRFWIPVIISILALVIALMSLGIDLVQLLIKLFAESN